jgi:hypothetical protein
MRAIPWNHSSSRWRRTGAAPTSRRPRPRSQAEMRENPQESGSWGSRTRGRDATTCKAKNLGSLRPLGWWGYQDLNLGPLPYQGVDPAVLEALNPL